MVSEIISALLILLFTYTGVSKIIDHNNFQGVLAQSPLIGWSAQILSWVIPVIELITAVLLLIPNKKCQGFLLATILMCLFTCYLLYMIVFESHLPCSCGGVIKQMSWRQHLLFNVFFTTIAIIGYRITLAKQIRLKPFLT